MAKNSSRGHPRWRSVSEHKFENLLKLSCDEHDRIFGLVSHFPQYISHKKVNAPILESYYASERALLKMGVSGPLIGCPRNLSEF